MLFSDIVMLDYKRPLVERAKSRKVCGPYHWTPQDGPNKGFGFYQASKGFQMDRHGSNVSLRIEPANDHIPNYWREAGIDGYYTDRFQDTTLRPIIARLPHGRGFLAGWTMGRGMCASLGSTIYSDIRDAALAAHSDAAYTAEQEQERDERENSEEDADDPSLPDIYR